MLSFQATVNLGKEVILCIIQSLTIIGVSPSDCLISYARRSLGKSYSSVQMQTVYLAALPYGAVLEAETFDKYTPLNVLTVIIVKVLFKKKTKNATMESITRPCFCFASKVVFFSKNLTGISSVRKAFLQKLYQDYWKQNEYKKEPWLEIYLW